MVRCSASSTIVVVLISASMNLVTVGLWYSAQLQTANEGLIETSEKLEKTNGKLETAISEKEAANGQLQQEKAEAEKQRQLARRFLYVSQINLADRAQKEGKPGLALQLLETVGPEALGKEDLRGPEWFHLWNVCRGYAFALHGHAATITAMEFSPNGRWLAAGAEDGRIIVWDSLQSKVHQEFAGQGKSVSGLRFTQDSKILVGRTDLGSIGAWDVLSGRELSPSPKSQAEADRAAASALSQLANLQQSRSDLMPAFKDWSTSDGNPLPVICMAFTPDNRTAVAGFGPDPRKFIPSGKNPAGGNLVVYEVGEKSEKSRLQVPVPVSSVALSACGRHLAWAGEDRVIYIPDLEHGKDGQSLAFNSPARLLAFSSDQRLLASAHADHTIRVWQLHPRQVETIFQTPDEDPVNNVVFNPKGGQIAASCRGTIKVWVIPSGKALLNLPHNRSRLWSTYRRLAYSADGRWLTDGARVIDIASGKELSGLKLPDMAPYGTAFSPDGKLVVSAPAGGDGVSERVVIWHTATGNVLHTLKAPAEWPVCVTFSPDGKLLVAGSATGSHLPGGFRVWEVATGREVHNYTPTVLNTFCIAFSPDGKWLATGHGPSPGGNTSFPGEIKIWDAQSWAQVMSLQGHTSSVWWLSFSPDGKRLASAAGSHSQAERKPGEIKIWDLTLGQELLTLKGHTGCVRGVSFSPNGKVLVSGSEDGTIRLWGDLTGTMR
jgi:WD40 repeat protein